MPSSIARDSATIVAARAPGMPSFASSSTLARASSAAVGKTRSSPGPSSTARPKRAASRPASVVAAFTVTCWPSTARTAVSNGSNAPGTRSPGRAATSGARSGSAESTSAIRSGLASRSKSARSRGTIAPTDRASSTGTCATSAARSGSASTSTRPPLPPIAPART